jgi:GntR family transcriptional regulator/MocR family aminotransferase
VEGLDLHLGVDKGAGFVGRALETALREAIRSGRLHAGVRLPGSRSLAADLPGPASWPAAGAGDDPAPAAARLAVDLRPGRPDLSSFPRTDWASSVRRALAAAPYEDLD